uniref:Flocculation protein FLO11-like n=1 Tax=Saccoglossus kowalevskii TaxID=10224 RepID=A0ABM0M5P8_SACKO|nr:PREDICTED: flocculation protein FLO11-like [Saccoglossus kowalevskii]
MVPGSGISGIINSNVGKLQTVTVPVTQFNSVSGSFTFPTQTIITVDGLNKPVSQVPLVTRRSKRTKKHHASEEFEYQPVVKRSKVDAQPIGMAVNQEKESSVMFTAADSSQLHTGRDETDGVQLLQETHVNVQKVCDIPQENRPETDELVKMPTAILSRRRSSVALGNKPSPLRVLHNDPEFRSSPTDSVNSSKNASPVDSKFDAKDLELAVPLQEDHTEDTKHDDAPKTVQAQNDQTVTTCLPKPELPGSLASEQVKETPSVSSAESSQTSLLFSQSPLHLLLNNRSSSNSPARFMSRPSSLSSMAELERAFGSGESPFPIVSPNPVFGKRSKSASPSHFQSLINSQAQAMLAGMSQQTAPTKVNSVSPVLLPHGGMNTSTSPSDFSFNNSMFSFSFNQLLQGASNQHTPVSSAPAQPAQAMNSIPTTALPLVPTTMQSMPNTILQMPHMTQLSLLQAPQTNGNIVHLPTTTTFVQTPMSSRVQTSMAHLSVPMYQTSHPNQINQVAPVPFSFTQAQVAQWSTPITGSAHNRAALMAGMSPIMPSETYSPKSLTPGDKSYQNMLFTPRTQMSPATTLNTTPLINTELNNSSFFHTPNMYSMANTGNLLQHNAPQVIGPSAFQHVPANLPANGKFTTSRRLALPQFSESFKQPPQA